MSHEVDKVVNPPPDTPTYSAQKADYIHHCVTHINQIALQAHKIEPLLLSL